MEEFEDRGVAITLGVLALSGIVLLAGHMKSVSLDRSLLEKQLVVLADRVTASKAARKQVDEAFEQREQQLKRAAATEAQYAGLLTDLLELAKVDPDAKLVVQKWKIQSSGDTQPSPPESAPKASTPAPESRPSKAAPGAPAPQKPKSGP
jgi:hypothetical protein